MNSRINVPLTVSMGSKARLQISSLSSAPAAHRRERTAEHMRRFSRWKEFFANQALSA